MQRGLADFGFVLSKRRPQIHFGICSSLAPRLAEKSLAAGPHAILKQALRHRANYRAVKALPGITNLGIG